MCVHSAENAELVVAPPKGHTLASAAADGAQVDTSIDSGGHVALFLDHIRSGARVELRFAPKPS